jgi:2-oxoisovalerate dehydrogenase E2 component (dihydrolipoyl transacylase)
MPEQVFHLPDVGEGLTEAEIVAWHVQVGDEVSVNDALLDVETAKSVVELPSPFEGVVLDVHGEEGDTLPVGAALITIGSAAVSPVSPALPEADPVTVDIDPPVQRVPRLSSAGGTHPSSIEPLGAPPLVLVGTGPREAAVRRVHVRVPEAPAFERQRPGGASLLATTSVPASAADTRLLVKGVRKATAEAMVRSAFSAPHASMWTSVDVTATMDLVRSLKKDRGWVGVHVSPLVLLARTVALAVRRYPAINASWDDAAGEIVLRGHLNLGIAAATPRGLLVPNIKNAGAMSLPDLASALQDLVARARAGRLAPDDMSGGTLTLTNVGTFGVEGATPILNPPEAAILGLGVIRPRPWVVEGSVEVREVMTLSISIDHRVVDGELGGNVLRHIAELLSVPARALL